MTEASDVPWYFELVDRIEGVQQHYVPIFQL